ncbi:MAG TPA: LUD domain-containing protein [bacterium]|nr:LUD domain-containing protein [bacterium]HPN41873.1 LUD domain-containing protein [bacterium]
MNSSRETILNAVKKAVKNPSHLPESPAETENLIQESLKAITPADRKGLRNQFEKELLAVSGEFVPVKSTGELVAHISKDLQNKQYRTLILTDHKNTASAARQLQTEYSAINYIRATELEADARKTRLAFADAALVGVDHAIADTASLAVLQADSDSMFPHFLPDCIYVIVKPEQLIANLFDLFTLIPTESAKNMLLITGPSRTADIEKIIILGAHGPRRLVVYWLEE